MSEVGQSAVFENDNSHEHLNEVSLNERAGRKFQVKSLLAVARSKSS